MDTNARVKELAAERGLNLYSLAARCSVPYNTLKNSEARCGQLRLETIERICEGLGISLTDFFSGTPA